MSRRGSRVRRQRPGMRAPRQSRRVLPSEATGSSVLGSGERREATKDRRHVPIRVQEDRRDDEHEREPCPYRNRARPEGPGEREDGADNECPADHMVEKRGPGVEPAVLLVEEDRG